MHGLSSTFSAHADGLLGGLSGRHFVGYPPGFQLGMLTFSSAPRFSVWNIDFGFFLDPCARFFFIFEPLWFMGCSMCSSSSVSSSLSATEQSSQASPSWPMAVHGVAGSWAVAVRGATCMVACSLNGQQSATKTVSVTPTGKS